jgi:2-polyprenyl-3-methyl-5-hydroxy-6-metoxy-1,4-benzoquinol methylase
MPSNQFIMFASLFKTFKMRSHERADSDIENNVTYQRCMFAYEFVAQSIKEKKVLDVGCGNADGTSIMADSASEINGMDYSHETIAQNKLKFKNRTNMKFQNAVVPPIEAADETYDVVTAFQFIEHIHLRKEFIKEAARVTCHGGKLFITTPNIKRSLARNPFHIHEYTVEEMEKELSDLGLDYTLYGLFGNEKVEKYYQENSKWVKTILKLDVFGLHKILPSALLAKPYDLITSLMRKKLMQQVSATTEISTNDFFLSTENLDSALDIYVVINR